MYDNWTIGWHCGCATCTDDVWNAQVTALDEESNNMTTTTCGNLIQQERRRSSLVGACQQISTSYLDACAPCNPQNCTSPKPFYCGSDECQQGFFNWDGCKARGPRDEISCTVPISFGNPHYPENNCPLYVADDTFDDASEEELCVRVALLYRYPYDTPYKFIPQCGACAPDWVLEKYTSSPTNSPTINPTSGPTSQPTFWPTTTLPPSASPTTEPSRQSASPSFGKDVSKPRAPLTAATHQPSSVEADSSSTPEQPNAMATQQDVANNHPDDNNHPRGLFALAIGSTAMVWMMGISLIVHKLRQRSKNQMTATSDTTTAASSITCVETP